MADSRMQCVPQGAGDFARTLNGNTFALNGGRSSESAADRNRGQLHWITSVMQQFDCELKETIKFAKQNAKPQDYRPTAHDQFTNWGRACSFAEQQQPSCSYYGPCLVKQNEQDNWMCYCCADIKRLEGNDLDNDKVFDSQGKINPMKTSEYTFDKINQMADADVVTHLDHFLFILRRLTQDAHRFKDADGEEQIRAKNVFKLQSVKEAHKRFQKHNGMSLPVSAETFRSFVYELGTAYGLRSNKNPTILSCNTNSLNNTVLTLMERTVGESMEEFQSWFATNVGEVDSLVGFLITIATIEFVSHCIRQTDEITAYAVYFRLKQGNNQNPKDYLRKHEENRSEVVRARQGKIMDQTADHMKFLEGLQPSILASVQQKVKLAYKGQPLTWQIILQVVDMISDETASSHKGVSMQAMGNVIDERIQQQVHQAMCALNSGGGGSSTGGSSGGYAQPKKKAFIPNFPCPACGSTKENPIGERHHFGGECFSYDFKMNIDDNDKPYVEKCEKKPGCDIAKPYYKVQQEQGKTMYWDLEKFKESRAFKFLKNERAKKRKNGMNAMSNSSKKSKKGKKKKQTFTVSQDGSQPGAAMSSSWDNIFGAIARFTNFPDMCIPYDPNVSVFLEPESQVSTTGYDIDSKEVLMFRQFMKPSKNLQNALKLAATAASKAVELALDVVKFALCAIKIADAHALDQQAHGCFWDVWSESDGIGPKSSEIHDYKSKSDPTEREANIELIVPLVSAPCIVSLVHSKSSAELQKEFKQDSERVHIPYDNDNTRDGAYSEV